jgi:DNA-binding CsgD family transcriptional regulator
MTSKRLPLSQSAQTYSAVAPSGSVSFGAGCVPNRHQTNPLVELFGQFGCGIFILAEDGTIVQMNEVAQLHTSESLKVVNRRVRAVGRIDDENLQEVIKRVLAGAPHVPVPAQIVISRRTQLPLILHVMPLVPHEGCPQCALLSFDPECVRAPTEPVLRQVFGLTPREASLALYICQGFSIKEIASEFCITEDTARSHIKSVMAKTGARRQSELTALLLQFGFIIGR